MEYNAVGGDEIIVTNPYAVGPAPVSYTHLRAHET